MPLDPGKLKALVAEVGRFQIRDRALVRAQSEMSVLFARGEVPSDRAAGAYLHEVRRYFAASESEARNRLRSVESRLTRVSQEQFNLTAERSVAARRIEVTQGVIARLAEIERG